MTPYDRPEYADLSPTAQLVFSSLTRLCDDEGRFWADGRTVQLQALLLTSQATEVAEAVSDLEEQGFVQTYRGGEFLFIPDHFRGDWNGRRKYWKKSQFPLPDADALADHPEYLDALRRINRKSRLAYNGEPDLFDDSRNGPRYPELWPEYGNNNISRHFGGCGGTGRERGGRNVTQRDRGESRGNSTLRYATHNSLSDSNSGGGDSLLRPQERELRVLPQGAGGRSPPPLSTTTEHDPEEKKTNFGG